MEFDLENPFIYIHELHSDTLCSLFLTESDHMPSRRYCHSLAASDSDFSIRAESISLISQCCGNFDPFLTYLAINYLDRFLSGQGMPQPKPWVLRLIAFSCVSLAAKMKKTELSLVGFQGNGGFIFDPQTIQRMEVLILGALKWRMRSITPFSFIPFFISLFQLKHPALRQALKDRATEIIIIAQTEIKLLEFKPSVVAASALLSASHELFPLQYPSFRKSISNCSYVNEENMFECFNAIEEIVINGYETVFDMIVMSTDTPVNVLDNQLTSSEGESTIDTTTVNTNHKADRDAKRRKINGCCNLSTVQISQVQQC